MNNESFKYFCPLRVPVTTSPMKEFYSELDQVLSEPITLIT